MFFKKSLHLTINSLQVGRKTIILSGAVLLLFVGLAVAILVNHKLQSAVARYAIVVLICLYAFGFALAWLYVCCVGDYGSGIHTV